MARLTPVTRLFEERVGTTFDRALVSWQNCSATVITYVRAKDGELRAVERRRAMASPVSSQLSVVWPLGILLIPLLYGFLLWILARLRQ
jgi:hypothetical protein